MRFADDLILFAHLVDNGSYSATARALGVQKSFLSRRIAALETALGLNILQRGANGIRVTDLGNQVYAKACKMRENRDEAFRIVEEQQRTPSGVLNVVCPPLLSEMLFGDVAVAFAADHPKVRLNFEVRTILPTAGLDAYDVVILPATGGLPDADFVARRILLAEYRLVASPRWQAESGKASLEKLQGCVAIGWAHDGAPEIWKLTDEGGNIHELAVSPTLRTNDLALAARAAIAGLGLARLPAAQAIPHIAAGRLVPILPDYQPHPVSIYAAYSSRRAVTAAGRAFLAALQEAAAKV
ncbi:transcriptional regulator, LysR family [Sphingobium chlorophenolicum L-1]|uniref:Transcriptional regulator, LysR family n=1 Tax=Sphingobium chlorophenolicum L-1 TaxID=690566 RepID=F6F3M5_SPHCR|nr:LysR substrate-binding domain-containing protein [Sphingobium chlorophenolicum]AEG51037.1 transcriptional regulator, LysR family [Sphingobium chlorophenolicum L-1]